MKALVPPSCGITVFGKVEQLYYCHHLYLWSLPNHLLPSRERGVPAVNIMQPPHGVMNIVILDDEQQKGKDSTPSIHAVYIGGQSLKSSLISPRVPAKAQIPCPLVRTGNY